MSRMLAQLPVVDAHLEPTGPKPADDQLGVGPGAVDEVARGVELALDLDERGAGGGGDAGCGHGVRAS